MPRESPEDKEDLGSPKEIPASHPKATRKQIGTQEASKKLPGSREPGGQQEAPGRNQDLPKSRDGDHQERWPL